MNLPFDPSLILRPEVMYVGLLFALFVLPKVLQRWRLPSAVTSLGLGAFASIGLGLFTHDATVQLLSTFGIAALFLFAGLDVAVDELRRVGPVLVQHLVVRAGALLVVGGVAAAVFDLDVRAASLVSLALLTPSTGFILDSLDQLGADEKERFWIKSKAIATELLALATLFVVLQSTSGARLGMSFLVLAAMVLLLPIVFQWFARWVAPYAPRSEFAFLLMTAVVCALITRELGVYYLVGAFVVGMAAERFRERLPALASEELVHAVQLFASFFVPFYFFHAGLELRREDFGPAALWTGAGFIVILLPLRIALVAVHRRIALGEAWPRAARVAVPMLPTLVFTLVLAGILRDRFQAPPALFGGLIVYTIVNTLLPSLFFRAPVIEYSELHAPAIRAFEEEAPETATPGGPAPAA